MKTLAAQNRRSLSRMSSFIILSASALFFSSCQKDDMLSPGPQAGMETNNRSEVSRISNTSALVVDANLLSASSKKENSTAAAFTMLSIDHACAQTSQPSYKIELKSDGTVLFTGRKNIATIGERKFVISQETVAAIRNMYIDSKFNKLESLPFTADQAAVTTSFLPKDNMELATKIDYNNDGSLKVIELRKASEKMLNISKLLIEKSKIYNLEENMAQQFN